MLAPNKHTSIKHSVLYISGLILSEIHKSGVIQYDDLKILPDSIEVRGNIQKPSADFSGKINVLEADRIAGKYPWESFIEIGKELEDATRPSENLDILKIWDENNNPTIINHPIDLKRKPQLPKIHYGLIGSANILLKDPKLRNKLSKIGVKAVEMEGSGVSDSAWSKGVGVIVIRGISDYCDPNKNDLWQGYASVVAAAYTRILISSFACEKHKKAQ